MPIPSRLLGVVAVALLAMSPVAVARKAKATEESFQRKLSKDKQVLHALDRLTFGPRLGDVDAVRKQGLKKWLDRQLHPERIEQNPILAAKLAPLASLTMTQAEAAQKYAPQRKKNGGGKTEELEPKIPITDILAAPQIAILRNGAPAQKLELIRSLPNEKLDALLIALPAHQRQQLMGFVPAEARRKMIVLNAPRQALNYDLSEGKVYRAVYSNRQLEELLADFWYNHFNVFLDKGADRYLVPTYEREAIRPRVLGKFRDLLDATAKSPAMLFYLDNWQSVAPALANARMKRPKQGRGLNENYARELMELHTLGVDGGYAQKDIVEVARCFTGWTIRAPQLGGAFEFNPRVHDQGEKVVLGVKIPAGGGMEDGARVLDILAKHPSTARFVARKLAMRFVADSPPASLVDRMARMFARTDGDIRATMKTMLDAPEFWSEGAYKAKVKTPFEMIVSAARALNAEVDYAFPLANWIAQLGQPLYRKAEPTGYSSANSEWVNSSALLARMNFALALAQNKIQGVRVDTLGLTDDPVRVAQAVMFQDVSPETRAAIQKALAEGSQPVTPALLAGLVIGSPEFQRR